MAMLFALICTVAALFFVGSARESWRAGAIHSAFVDVLAGALCLVTAVGSLASAL